LGTAISGPAGTWAAKLPEGIPRLQERLSFMREPINTLQRLLQQVEDFGGAEPSPNVAAPERDPASAPARASWGTADGDSRIKNVEQTSPTIAMRGMKAFISECVPLAKERAAATMCSSICPSQGMSGPPKEN
jgi:hypothetical protein